MSVVKVFQLEIGAIRIYSTWHLMMAYGDQEEAFHFLTLLLGVRSLRHSANRKDSGNF
jgi:hypothetical protein